MESLTDRFFVDQRLGNIAVRDRQHPMYDPEYPGLHKDTPDVIFYAPGFMGENGWTVNDFDIRKAHEVCLHLNSIVNYHKEINGITN